MGVDCTGADACVEGAWRMGAFDMLPGAEAGGGFMVDPVACTERVPEDGLLAREEGFNCWVDFEIGTEGGGTGWDCAGGGAAG